MRSPHVRGAVCPTALGTYRKRQGGRASLMAVVEVLPLSVNEQPADWKEKKQREHRWFSLGEAANVLLTDTLSDRQQSDLPSHSISGRDYANRLVERRGRELRNKLDITRRERKLGERLNHARIDELNVAGI